MLSSKSDIKDKSESRYSETPENNSTFTLQALEEGKSISIKVHNVEMKSKSPE